VLILIFLPFLLIPVGIALVASFLDAPDLVAPLLLAAFGGLWLFLALRLVLGLAREVGDEKDVPYAEALGEVEGNEMLARQPLASFVPFLFTAGWMLLLLATMWLAFVSFLAALGFAALLVIVFYLPRPAKWKPSGP
jgi:hypothetical protein